MSLNASLDKYKSEVASAASRNLQHARPAGSAPARTSTPKPAAEAQKRTHESAFSNASTPTASVAKPSVGGELLTIVLRAIEYLRSKADRPIAASHLIGFLSIPIDDLKSVPRIKTALRNHDRVDYLPKTIKGEDAYRYRPIHPVTTGDELRDYLARQPTAQGLLVKDLKDGWPDCVPVIDSLERQGHILVKRFTTKDNAPKTVYADSPVYHLINPATQMPQKADADFADLWMKTKLPAAEGDLRAELEREGLTPTSVVKESGIVGPKRKEKRKANRKSGKTTNNHMLGILKDYKR